MTDAASMLDRCSAAMADALPALNAVIARVAETAADPDVEYDSKLGSHLAWMVEKLVALSNELRQLEKHDRHQAKTPDQRRTLILTWLRQASPEEQAEALEVLTKANTRSVLG